MRRRRDTTTAAPPTAYTSANLEGALQELEERFDMTRGEFQVKWRAGHLDHGDYDMSRWALLLSALERAKRAEAA